MDNKIPKIIIVDDHDIFRDGIKSLLSFEGIAEVIAEAKNGKEFIDLLDNHSPDIVMMDIDMPVMNGIEATRLALTKKPQLNILVFTMFGEENYYYQMIEAGAKGFLLKSSSKSELEKAIHEVYTGQSYFSNDLLRQIIFKIGKHKPVKSSNKEFIIFSEREKDVIRLLCKGLSTIEISDEIHLSPKTIENYRAKILQKTQCKNSIQLVVYAIKNGLVEI
ncbi:MAG: response regulator transcription factor [Bacteroidales bacterium]|nr:response regulator transcription factor [Bacteroidales bacterium]